MRAEASRRVTGPHPVVSRPGAAVEVFFDDGDDAEALLDDLSARGVAGAAALGWTAEVFVKRYTRGATFGMSAPADLWMVCADWLDELTEGATAPSDALHRDADESTNPTLRAWMAWGAANEVPVLVDDDGIGIGGGAFGRVLDASALPSPDSAGEWRPAHLPAVGVTGTNGKTTTTRLIDHLARSAGHHAGHTSSDGVRVAGEWLERGDWSGPTAARRLLRSDVELAVIELARGGLLRRGLAAVPLDVAVVTNVSADHLGEYGVESVHDVALVKLFIHTLLRPGGTLVVNADCAPLMAAVPEALAHRPDVVVRTFSRTASAHAAVQHEEAFIDGVSLGPLQDWPVTLGGTAAYNVENALAAALAAHALDLPIAAIQQGLASFRPNARQSPGRGNLLTLNGTTWLLDFGHNPDGVARLGAMTAQWAYKRRLVTLSQAGDRTDTLLRELGETAVQQGFDHIVVKGLPHYGRGRDPMDVAAQIASGAREAGGTSIEVLPDELTALRHLMELAQPGDIVLFLVHESFREALAILTDAGAVEASGPPLG